MSFTTELTRQQVFFEVLRSEAVRRFPMGVMTRADGFYQDATQEMIAELSAHVCAEKLVEETQTAVFFYRRPHSWLAFLDVGAGWAIDYKRERSSRAMHVCVTWQNPHHWFKLWRNPHGLWYVTRGREEQ